MWLIVRQLLITCLTLHTFLSWFQNTNEFLPIFKCLSLYISEFTHISICFTPMFHSFVIPPFQGAPAGSAKRCINTFLVAWPMHSLLILWPASPHRLLHFRQFFNVWVCTCLSLHLSSHVYSHVFIHLQFFCIIVPPHSKAVHQHPFSRLAGAQFTDCMTCLLTNVFIPFSTHYYFFTSFSMF